MKGSLPKTVNVLMTLSGIFKRKCPIKIVNLWITETDRETPSFPEPRLFHKCG